MSSTIPFEREAKSGRVAFVPHVDLVVLARVAEVEAPQEPHGGGRVAFLQERTETLLLQDPEAIPHHLDIQLSSLARCVWTAS